MLVIATNWNWTLHDFPMISTPPEYNVCLSQILFPLPKSWGASLGENFHRNEIKIKHPSFPLSLSHYIHCLILPATLFSTCCRFLFGWRKSITEGKFLLNAILSWEIFLASMWFFSSLGWLRKFSGQNKFVEVITRFWSLQKEKVLWRDNGWLRLDGLLT